MRRYGRRVRDPYPPAGYLGDIYLTEEQIQTRVAELGAEIADDLAGEVPLLVTILKGSVLFAADLMRAIPGAVEIDFMAVSSYGDDTKSSGIVKIVKDLDESIAGRQVILIEDIVDSGLTMTYLLNHLSSSGTGGHPGLFAVGSGGSAGRRGQGRLHRLRDPAGVRDRLRTRLRPAVSEPSLHRGVHRPRLGRRSLSPVGSARAISPRTDPTRPLGSRHAFDR